MERNKWGSSQCAITADYLNERKLKENKIKLPYSYLGRALLGLIQSEDEERGRSFLFLEGGGGAERITWLLANLYYRDDHHHGFLHYF